MISVSNAQSIWSPMFTYSSEGPDDLHGWISKSIGDLTELKPAPTALIYMMRQSQPSKPRRGGASWIWFYPWGSGVDLSCMLKNERILLYTCQSTYVAPCATPLNSDCLLILSMFLTSGWHCEATLHKEASSHACHSTETVWLWLGKVWQCCSLMHELLFTEDAINS